MENNEVLLRAVETITDKPVTYTIPIAESEQNKSLSLWDRLLIKVGLKEPKEPETSRTVTVRRLVLGNMERVGGRALNIPNDILEASISKVVVEGSFLYMKDFIYIAACGIQNNREEPSLELQDFIRWNCSMKQVFELCDIVLSKADYQSFINTTVLIKGADALGVQEKDADTVKAPDSETAGQLAGEIIAPGQS